MSELPSQVINKLKQKSAIIGILGLGYVGQPLLLRYSDLGYKVIGFDVDEDKVQNLNRGNSKIAHIDDTRIQGAVDTGFEATTDYSRVAECDALILCVPTPLNKYREPDMSYVVTTTDMMK